MKTLQRSAARLAAVQALYQMEISGKGVQAVAQEFKQVWIGQEVEGAQYPPAELAFFEEVIRGSVLHQERIDSSISQALPKSWPLKRLQRVLRAILRAGTYELLQREDIPVRVILKEYVDVAGAFFNGQEAGMVNGVLNHIAHHARQAELAEVKISSCPGENPGEKAGLKNVSKREEIAVSLELK